MIKIIEFIRKNRKKEITNFFDYPVDVQKKLVVEAINRANESQLELVKKFKLRYGNMPQ
jgi:hypothetical protein